MYSNTPTLRSAFLALLLSILFINAALRAQPLSGQYTIGGTSASYPTFRAAIHALDSFGVSGPVVFNVRSGTYQESDTIRAIARASAVNTITFQSESGDSSDVTLEWNSQNSGDWNLWLYRTGFITFKHMGFRQTFDNGLHNVKMIKCHNITFQNCRFEGTALLFDGTLLSGTVDSNLTILNSYFTYARHGISLSSEKGRAKNLRIEGSFFQTERSGIVTTNAKYVSVQKNYFTNISGSTYRGLVIQGSQYLDIAYNYFKVDASASHTCAMDFNDISADTAARSWIYNNVVNMDASEGNQVYAFKLGNAQNATMAHNTFKLNTVVPEHAAIRFYPNPGGISDCQFYNNVVANVGNGPCYVYNNNANTGLENDYNLWYSGAGLITPTENSVATLTARNGSNQHSYFGDPQFEDANILRALSPYADSNAFVFNQIQFDFAANRRNNSVPDIGAYENLHLPQIQLPEDTSSCGPILLSAESQASLYSWNTGARTSEITATSSGQYWVTAFNGDGRNTDSVYVTISGNLPLSLSSNADSLNGVQCATLTASFPNHPKYTGTWSGSLTTVNNQPQLVVCPFSLPATYYFELTDTAAGCITKDSITLYPAFNSVVPSFAVQPNGTGSQAQGHETISGVGSKKASGSSNSGSKEAEKAMATNVKPVVYPNPGAENLFVKFPVETPQVQHVFLTDLAGNKIPIDYQLIGPGLFELDIRFLANGSYFLIIVTMDNVFPIQVEKLQ